MEKRTDPVSASAGPEGIEQEIRHVETELGAALEEKRREYTSAREQAASRLEFMAGETLLAVRKEWGAKDARLSELQAALDRESGVLRSDLHEKLAADGRIQDLLEAFWKRLIGEDGTS